MEFTLLVILLLILLIIYILNETKLYRNLGTRCIVLNNYFVIWSSGKIIEIWDLHILKKVREIHLYELTESKGFKWKHIINIREEKEQIKINL